MEYEMAAAHTRFLQKIRDVLSNNPDLLRIVA